MIKKEIGFDLTRFNFASQLNGSTQSTIPEIECHGVKYYLLEVVFTGISYHDIMCCY